MPIEPFFEKITPSAEQVEALYKLLTQREHNISHKQDVSYDEHELFVRGNPYRAWYIVKLNGAAVGSFYVSNENTIGINIEKCEDIRLISEVLTYVMQNYQPLEAIPSVRSKAFAINVAPGNHSLLDALRTLGAELAQVTYFLPNE